MRGYTSTPRFTVGTKRPGFDTVLACATAAAVTHAAAATRLRPAAGVRCTRLVAGTRHRPPCARARSGWTSGSRSSVGIFCPHAASARRPSATAPRVAPADALPGSTLVARARHRQLSAHRRSGCASSTGSKPGRFCTRARTTRRPPAHVRHPAGAAPAQQAPLRAQLERHGTSHRSRARRQARPTTRDPHRASRKPAWPRLPRAARAH